MARKNLLSYVTQTFPDYQVNHHHKTITNALQRVESGDLRRVIFVIPPRHGKSTIASQRFPAWYLGKHPRRDFISVGATGRLAMAFGRSVRNLMREPQHRLIFPGVELAKDSQAANEWRTNQDGIFIASGVLGSIVGRGASILSIDDPIPGAAAADSPHMRDVIWNWYLMDARTRLHPDAAIVVTSTRWHVDDPIGRLKKQMEDEGEQWEIIHFKAIDDDGNALWEDRYSLKDLQLIRKILGPRAWSALYQGEPMPDGGLIFAEKHFEYYDYAELEANIRQHGWDYYQFYASSDYAVSEEEGDYTVHLVFAVDPFGRIYLVDRYHEQSSSDEWVKAFCYLIRKWPIKRWAEESGQIIKGVGPFLKQEVAKTVATYRCSEPYRKQFASSTNKVVRARSAEGRFGMDPLRIPIRYANGVKQPIEWVENYKAEMLAFFTGPHDDQVDTTSLFCRMLNDLEPGESPAAPMPEPQGLLDMPLQEIMKKFDQEEGSRTSIGWVR